MFVFLWLFCYLVSCLFGRFVGQRGPENRTTSWISSVYGLSKVKQLQLFAFGA